MQGFGAAPLGCCWTHRGSRGAPLVPGTLAAPRHPTQTHTRTKIHERFVPPASPTPWQKRIGNLTNLRHWQHIGGGWLPVAKPAEHTPNVDIDHRDIHVEGKGKHCTGSVVADTGELAQCMIVLGDRSAMAIDNCLGARMQVGCTPVVSQAVPGSDHLRRYGSSKSCNGREALQKSWECPLDAPDLRLLEHHLGNEHMVWVSLLCAPRQQSAIVSKPCAQAPTEPRPQGCIFAMKSLMFLRWMSHGQGPVYDCY